MSTQFSFHGGVHPPENKHRTTGLSVQTAPIPAELVVPLSQHIGAPSEIIVAIGDKVLKGQVIAEAAGRISVNVHAPSSGTVVAIEKRAVPHISGMQAPCIIIETDGDDRWVEHQGLADYHTLPKQELIDFVRHHGISGMGGAGFPTDVKLHLGDDHIVNTLVINAMECEPYITADDMLLREHSDKVIKGIEVIAHLLQPSHVMIGIEDNKPQAIRALELAAKETKLNLDIVVVPTVYPSGGEKQLIKLLTGIEVPSGHIPADVGIVCQNVGTTAAIYDAVFDGIPLISRIVTLAGEALAHPHNMRALIGTPLEVLLEAAEINQNALYRLVMGGPMMGFTVESQSIPMIKTTNCIIAASYEEMPPAPPANPCIRCGMCEQVCPAELLPQQLHWFAKGKEFDKAKQHNLFDCIECGACSYVCPSNIPLVQYYRFAKSEIRNEEAEQRKADHARIRFEARQARLEQEKADKEARRKQRAADAAKAQAVKKDKAASSPDSEKAKSGEPDLKALKTAAAVSRTKLKKAQKALQNAQDKELDGQDKLKATVAELEAKAEAAQQAFDQAQNAPATAAPVLDIKQLKTNAAVARTKLKQAEKALDKAEASGEGDIEALRVKLSEQQAKTVAAQAAYDSAESGGAAAHSVSNEKLEGLKADMEAALGKVNKAQKALNTAIEGNSPAVEKMKAGVEKLQAKYDTLKAEYESTQNLASTVAVAVSPEQVADLKADMDGMAAKVEKAQKALDVAIESGSPAADKMKAGVEKLQAKYEAAKDEYEKAILPLNSAPLTIDLEALKADIDAMSGKVQKAQTALATAQTSGSPAAEKMRAGVAKLQSKLDDLHQEYIQAGGRLAEPEPEVIDPKALKQQVSIMRTKLKKAQQAIEAVKEQGNTEDLSELNAEVERLTTLHNEAKAAFDAYEKTQIDKAAAEGIDLKQLKIDAAMARAAVTKAERAAKKAREEKVEDLSGIEQQLVVAQQEAEHLNQTLSRFTD